MRTNIKIGAVRGKMDVQNASGVFGSRITALANTEQRISGIITGHCSCCASSSEFTIAPTAAYIVLYSRYPSRKKIGRQI